MGMESEGKTCGKRHQGRDMNPGQPGVGPKPPYMGHSLHHQRCTQFSPSLIVFRVNTILQSRLTFKLFTLKTTLVGGPGPGQLATFPIRTHTLPFSTLLNHLVASY
ncbi:hypothetical protein ILYODFUR_011564 [Ilyodon furcidens]|uniref:Uncharacterized protein n=1 Tax=Ilyodon furcidens TaxID=33524 RepID=A0ABV0UUZ6_9TELE